MQVNDNATPQLFRHPGNSVQHIPEHKPVSHPSRVSQDMQNVYQPRIGFTVVHTKVDGSFAQNPSIIGMCR
jgi:hypothetical protein